jgi:lipid-binding SYLF domain-containing protein
MIFKSKRKYMAALMLTLLLSAGTVSANGFKGESRAALDRLTAQNPAAAIVSSRALAVLVFPNAVKAGFLFGGHRGEGTLFVDGRYGGHYRTVAGSYGLEAGMQTFGYALFFMNQKAVDWVSTAHGWSIGSGPSVVLVDKGMARTINAETLHRGIYAFTFDQQGLMAGLGIQGSKITRMDWRPGKPCGYSLGRGSCRKSEGRSGATVCHTT